MPDKGKIFLLHSEVMEIGLRQADKSTSTCLIAGWVKIGPLYNRCPVVEGVGAA